MSLASKIAKRAEMLAQVRSFFAENNILEVDTPILSSYSPVDAHIDIMTVDMGANKTGYLHSSPEYAMKRLLSGGSGDIYQLSHVFRKEEKSPLHSPEFTLIEWYRLNFTLDQMIADTIALISLFVPETKKVTLSYREAFKKYAGIDYLYASREELIQVAEKHNLLLPKEDKEALLNYIWGSLIEPKFEKEALTVITPYPAAQAALSTISKQDDEMIANRFEVYHQGIELANGYHELRDPDEQKRRLKNENKQRIALGKKPLPIDPHFLAALEKGLPPCSGVAVGFDRLLMIHLKCSTLSDVILP